jgi:predicted DNA-binding protein (MmcQ/YjbR family)
MNLDIIRDICKNLPFVEEDIKWADDLCFTIGGKMFCVAMLNTPLKVSLKVPDEEFDEMINLHGIIPAPYVARYKWILVEDANIFTRKQWEFYITQSYNLIKNKLSKKKLAGLK